MRRQIRWTLVAVSLAVLPAQASEVGILVGRQVGAASGIQSSFSSMDSTNAITTTGYGIRGEYTMQDDKVFEWGFSATYHANSQADLEVNDGGNVTKYGKVKFNYMAVGAEMDWKFLVNFHLGLDLRRMDVSNDTDFSVPLNDENGSYTINGSATGIIHAGHTTMVLPWIKAGLGFTIPLPGVSPFVRVEAAYAVRGVFNGMNEDEFRGNLTPHYTVDLYCGVHF